MMQSLYDTLQVRRDANEQQIRKAYYKLSLVVRKLKWHYFFNVLMFAASSRQMFGDEYYRGFSALTPCL